MNSSPHLSPIPNPSPRLRRQQLRACDFCHRRKVRCDSENRQNCSNCKALECRYYFSLSEPISPKFQRTLLTKIYRFDVIEALSRTRKNGRSKSGAPQKDLALKEQGQKHHKQSRKRLLRLLGMATSPYHLLRLHHLLKGVQSHKLLLQLSNKTQLPRRVSYSSFDMAFVHSPGHFSMIPSEPGCVISVPHCGISLTYSMKRGATTARICITQYLQSAEQYRGSQIQIYFH
jgi:hypothetical protein